MAKRSNNGAPRLVMMTIALVILCGTYLVTRALLSKRQVVPDRNANTCFGYEYASAPEQEKKDNSGKTQTPPVDQVVVVLIDALRPDFAVPLLKRPMARGSRCADYFDKSPEDRHRFEREAEEIKGDLTYIHESLSESESSLKSYAMFLVADSPTTTSQRLKALTTGGLPAFVEAGSNFNADAISEDSIIYQLLSRKKDQQTGANVSEAVIMGDDTWLQLYPEKNWKRSDVYPSFDVRDLHSNDNLVLDLLFDELERPAEEAASFVIAHFLGVDHAGHRYNADNVHMESKLRQLNRVLRNISQTLTEVSNKDGKRRMMLVFGDHGMTDSGDHGGASSQETDTFVFSELFEPGSSTQATQKDEEFDAKRLELLKALSDHRINECHEIDDLCPLTRCSPLVRIRHQGTMKDLRNKEKHKKTLEEEQHYAKHDERAVKNTLYPGPVFQVDLVPTMSMLLGLPVPYSTLGRIIPEFLLLAATPDRIPEHIKQIAKENGEHPLERYLTQAMKCNLEQMTNYFEAAGMQSGHHHEQALKEKLAKMHKATHVDDGQERLAKGEWMADYFKYESAIASMSHYARMQRTHIDLEGLFGGTLFLFQLVLPLLFRFFSNDDHPFLLLGSKKKKNSICNVLDTVSFALAFFAIVAAVLQGLVLDAGDDDSEETSALLLTMTNWAVVKMGIICACCLATVSTLISTYVAQKAHTAKDTTTEKKGSNKKTYLPFFLQCPFTVKNGFTVIIFIMLTLRFGVSFSNSFIAMEVDGVHFILQSVLALCALTAIFSTNASGATPTTSNKNSPSAKQTSAVLMWWALCAALCRLTYSWGVRDRMHGTHVVAGASPLDEWLSNTDSNFILKTLQESAGIEVSLITFAFYFLGNVVTIVAISSTGLASCCGGPIIITAGLALGFVYACVDGTPNMHMAPIIALGGVILSKVISKFVLGKAATAHQQRTVGLIQRLSYGLLLCWLISLTQQSNSSRFNSTFMTVFTNFIVKFLLASTQVGYLQAITLHLAGWMMFFTMGQQCEASTLDWNAAFVGMKEYNMELGGSLVMMRTFFPFFVTQVVGGMFQEAAAAKKHEPAVAKRDGDEPRVSVSEKEDTPFTSFSFNARQRLLFLALCQIVFAALNVAKHRQHLMLWTIFNPKFLADCGMAYVSIMGYFFVEVVSLI